VALLGCWDLKRVIYYLSSTGSQATNGTRAAHTATKPNAIPAGGDISAHQSLSISIGEDGGRAFVTL
jgi:hypothetical protein